MNFFSTLRNYKSKLFLYKINFNSTIFNSIKNKIIASIFLIRLGKASYFCLLTPFGLAVICHDKCNTKKTGRLVQGVYLIRWSVSVPRRFGSPASRFCSRANSRLLRTPMERRSRLAPHVSRTTPSQYGERDC